MKEFRRCTRCVMDNKSDDTIEFDDNGVCNYCREAEEARSIRYFPNAEGEEKLAKLISFLKKEGEGKDYDCIMGLSGGLDSSYLAYLGHKWGLRILGLHVDDGYDTDISKNNIKKLCEAANIELRTIKPDSKQFNALTLAYMRAGVPDIAVPQDNVLFAFLYENVKLSGVKYFLAGTNYALECILQKGNTYNALDVVNIKDINRRFGTDKIDKLKFVSSYRKYWNLKTGRVVTYLPLNYIDYNRERAFKELNDFCGFEYYGRKHLENKLTAFVQLYWFPQKFGVDKRTSHLSSMIMSGQMTREEALKELEEPLYNESEMNEFISLIKKNMGISDAEFEQIMKAPCHQHTDYKTDKLANFLRKFIK